MNTVVPARDATDPLDLIKGEIEARFLISMLHPSSVCHEGIQQTYCDRMRAISVTGPLTDEAHIAGSLLEVCLNSSKRLGIETPHLSATVTTIADGVTEAEVSIRCNGPEHYLGQFQNAMELALEEISDIDRVVAEVRFITWKEGEKRYWAFNLTAKVLEGDR